MDSLDSAIGAIEAARDTDLSHIQWLLSLENLPSEDITAGTIKHFLVSRDCIGVAGVVGLEYYGKFALLRSLVVANGYERRGLGRRLVAAAEYSAKRHQVESIYLLTTTAESYFGALGFHSIPRACAPLALGNSSQFKSLCPSTAVLMAKP